MNTNEFLSSIKSRGATIYEPAQKRDVELANTALQSRRCAMFPTVFLDLYILMWLLFSMCITMISWP